MQHAPSLSIGKLARLADVRVPTIRFYEQIGLLPEPDRTDSERRIYGDAAVRRLAFIRHTRQLGFSVDAIRSLLALSDAPEQPCQEADALAAAQLADVDRKIAAAAFAQVEEADEHDVEAVAVQATAMSACSSIPRTC